MIELGYMLFAAAFAVMVLAWRDRAPYRRNIALALGVMVTMVAGWHVFNAGLSRPLPTDRAIFADRARAGELLWVGQAPPDAFHILVRWPDDPQPRYYSLPWSEALAAELERAMAGLADGQTIGVSPFRFDGYNQGDEPGIFHPLPQPADPLKETPPGQRQQES